MTIGQKVRVINQRSEYIGLIGQVTELTSHESALVKFSEEELNQAERPERVTGFKRPVNFYFDELQGVIE